MDRIKLGLIIILVMMSGLFSFARAEGYATQSPVGYWKMIDATTGKTKSIVQIMQSNNNTLVGKVIKVFPDANANHDVMLGKVILSDLRSHQNQWNEGKIFDTENGNTYQCSMHLTENGKKLNIRGYIGIPLIGHSQIWERVDLME